VLHEAPFSSLDQIQGLKLSNPWVLRWDTRHDRQPRLLDQAEAPGSTTRTSGIGNFIAFHGYLFEADDIPRIAGLDDASRAAAAYRRWGTAFVDRLRGAFALVIWDDDERRLLAVRDSVGLHPCFYVWKRELLLLSSSIDALLAQPEVSSDFNRVLVAEFAQNRFTGHQKSETFYADIKRLEPAHTLSLGSGVLRIARYWDPAPPGFAWATDEELSRFGYVFQRSVGNCLSIGADSVSLSGGFDSLSIAVAAAEQRRGLQAVCLRFDGTSGDEGSTQAAAAEALGMPLTMQTFSESLGGESFIDRALADSGRGWCPILSAWQGAYTSLYRLAAARGARRIMNGAGGDELFTIDTRFLADCVASFDVRALWRHTRAFQRTYDVQPATVAWAVLWHFVVQGGTRLFAKRILGTLAPEKLNDLIHRRRRRAALEPWLALCDRELVTTLRDRREKPVQVEKSWGEGAYVEAIRGIVGSSILQFELEDAFTGSSRTGLTTLFPYFDRDLVELMLRTHPEHLISGGRHKMPLRRLVTARLPKVSMRARKVDFTRIFHDLMRSDGVATWRRLVGRLRLAELGIVDPSRIGEFMDGYFAGRHQGGLLAWQVLATEMWLRARLRSRGAV
jgi:asparagine synthetase B (glutamine-hydrolysing)